jgi:hypothetical protein
MQENLIDGGGDGSGCCCVYGNLSIHMHISIKV